MTRTTEYTIHKSAAIAQPSAWKKGERIIFRILFIYFILQAVPLDPKYYRNIFNIQWSGLHYRDLFYLARYTPQFFPGNNSLSWGLNTLPDWGIIFLISIIGAVAWSVYDKKREEYNDLYYLMRVVLRYRLAIGVIAYGFIKLFPMQLPYPSLSLENTNYGDLTDWKIAYLSYGIAPSFEVYLGIIEIAGGILLLNRKSASIGAAIVLGSLGNVFLSSLGYNGGETIYCLYLLLMGVVIVWYDLLRWHSIIMLGKAAAPNLYQPAFYVNWKKWGRIFVKASFLLFMVGGYGYNAYAMYRSDGYQYPKIAGLVNASGLYNVSQFRINSVSLPYSLTDSVRWQNLVFEKWNTISIRSNRQVIPELTNTEDIYLKDADRTFESSGSVGRHFYRYQVDSVKQLLYLADKNKNYAGETLMLHYERPNERQIILSGLNEHKDSIYVVLDKINKIYLLDESYKIPQKRSVFEKQNNR